MKLQKVPTFNAVPGNLTHRGGGRAKNCPPHGADSCSSERTSGLLGLRLRHNSVFRNSAVNEGQAKSNCWPMSCQPTLSALPAAVKSRSTGSPAGSRLRLNVL